MGGMLPHPAVIPPHAAGHPKTSSAIRPMQGRERFLRELVFSLLVVLLAFLWRLAIDPWLGDQMPYATFIVAVAAAGLYAGVRSAVLAMLLGGVTAYFCFVPPRYHLGFARVEDQVGFSVYVLGAIGVVLITRARDRALRRSAAAAAEMRESAMRFHALADNIPQLAWMADEHGQRFWYNQRWLDYTGTTFPEMAGMGWEKLHHPDHHRRVMEGIRRSWERGEDWEDTFLLRGKDGTYRWFLTRAVPIHDEHGHVSRWFGTNTDVSDRMQTEEALRRSEKLAVVGRVVATVAHELNNPLTIATNHVFLAQHDPNDTTRSKHLERADIELRRASTLANRTLNFYAGSTSKQVLSMHAVVHEVLELFTTAFAERGIAVRQELANDCAVTGSRQEMWQVLVNLLSNALDAIGTSGVIRIRLKAVASLRTGDPFVRLTVADSGCGIDAKIRKKVFDPFFTTKRSSGLGLWIAKGIVEHHHGMIRLRSCTQAGHSGTVVWVMIPRANIRDCN
jgi:PAS domain S-box-containing protein